jgi:predicted nucleic-acid-binding Zn-ribbon protein
MGLFGVTCPKCGSDNVTKRKLSNNRKTNNFVKVDIKIENANCEFKCHKYGNKWTDTCGFLDSVGIEI